MKTPFKVAPLKSRASEEAGESAGRYRRQPYARHADDSRNPVRRSALRGEDGGAREQRGSAARLLIKDSNTSYYNFDIWVVSKYKKTR